jgi:hypothetical protein
MDIHFRVIRNTPDETSMGQKYWFQPAGDCDAISATANAPGFTPLIAVARHFGWDYRMLEAAASACNNKGEVAIVTSVEPKLFLVPATKGHGDAKFLIVDLLKATSEVAVRGLHFTHFGFLQGRFPETEVADIIAEILNPGGRVTLQKLVFDIDVRAESSLYTLMRPKL